MFQRIANNYAKNGYYPTDDETLAGVISNLEKAGDYKIRIFDPCCGEGSALAVIKQHFGKNDTESFGIELDKARAFLAAQSLDRTLCSDYQQTKIDKRAFGFLFLNPPYGAVAKDRARLSIDKSEPKRLEEIFFQLTVPSLQIGGVMALIIPTTCLTKRFMKSIAINFTDLTVRRAATDRFKQVVIFGRRIKRRTARIPEILPIGSDGNALINDDTVPLLSKDENDGGRYVIPAAGSPVRDFFTHNIDPTVLATEIQQFPNLWDQLELQHTGSHETYRAPLRKLGDWHLALALSSGVHEGLVQSTLGRTLLIKGDTYKEKVEAAEVERTETDDGEEQETRITTIREKFSPVIKAIDLTRGSEDFGNVFSIR